MLLIIGLAALVLVVLFSPILLFAWICEALARRWLKPRR